MAQENVFYINEDSKIVITGLSYTTDAGVETSLNAATITYTIKSAISPFDTVTGGTGTLSKVSGVDGKYIATVDKAVTALMTEGQQYIVDVPIAEGGRDGYRRVIIPAQYRGST